MKPKFLPAAAVWTLGISFALGAGAADSPASTNSNAQTMINAFLKQEATRLDAQFLEGITSRAEWEARRPELHQQYLEMLGLWPLPERTPLQPQITGVLERDEGFRVEKLHFQSWPHLYVTGNLYLPKGVKAGAKLPAVLYVCGHSGRGRDGNKTAFQHHGMWFATHGYACLIIDTLQLGEIAGIHHGTYRYNRWWWQACGYTPAGIECWNGIRAIDYLQSRPEVDPERIGVTGISGGGAATFWISAADDRVKVAVPVSGMGDLEDYVGEKVVNGHCDCMFLINTFQWPWTQIAALIAPRPMLFENSGHDTIFPMNGNDRIRARLERLYGFYTNRTDRLFDIGIQPGGHDDKPELRLMAYRWMNRFLKGDDSPVTEPELAPFDGKLLRVFPEDLPADELNTKIDELFVTKAKDSLPETVESFRSWREAKLMELRRVVLRAIQPISSAPQKASARTDSAGKMVAGSGTAFDQKYFPGRSKSDPVLWLAILDKDEPLQAKPEWLAKTIGNASTLLVSPRGSGARCWDDPAPYYIQRSLPLLGYTVDSLRVADVLTAIGEASKLVRSRAAQLKVIGRGQAGVIGAYAALFEPGIAEVVLVDPPATHRDGPIFLNVLRVVDVPETLGLLAPRPVTIFTATPDAFQPTASIYRAGGGTLTRKPSLVQ